MSHRTVLVLFLSSMIRIETAENGFGLIRKTLDKCVSKPEVFKCLKIQALKVVDRAVYSKSLNIVNGITITSDRAGRSLDFVPLNETKLEKLRSEEIDGLLADNSAKFLDSHKLEIRIPKLLEEGRKKSSKGTSGALMWALAIKGTFLAMAYKGIAVMAGTALIVGKMALLLSAILGLKKLVSNGKEKTTVEIVKHPKYSESHSYSNSYEDDGHYHRSIDLSEKKGRRKIYKFYVPEV